MLVLAQQALRRGVEIRVNWPGRISVFPIMGGIFFALRRRRLGPGGAADRSASPWRWSRSSLYARSGLEAVRAQDGAQPG